MTTIRAKGQQGGSVILEALIAILIFSMGILAVVAMQAKAVEAASEAKYRSDASMLASELIGQMWITDRTNTTLTTNFQGGSGTNGATYTTWLAYVMAALPGVTATVNQPTVAIDGSNVVTIVVYWKAPSDTSASAHKFTLVAQVR